MPVDARGLVVVVAILGRKMMSDNVVKKKGKAVYWVIGVLVFIAYLFVLVPPMFNLVNRVEPFVLGFPFSAFMIFILGLFIAAMLVLLYWIQNRRGEL
jgi:uncharacterized BrkB/YihY/UPF0761 family membrane protein